MTDRGGWILDLERQARRFAVVFVHLGFAFSTLRADLVDIKGTQLCINDYLAQPAPDQPTLHILNDFERVSKTKDATIGRLRERVLSDIDSGHVFILVSTISRNFFEPSPGSDLLADATHVFVPLDDPSGEDPLTVFPSYNSCGQDSSKLLIGCLEEVGSSTVHALSQAIWEEGRSPRDTIEVLSKIDIEALRGAGLVSVDGTSVQWTMNSVWKKFKSAVALVSARYTEESSWLVDTFIDLWVIERLIRNGIRDALIAKQGEGWRDGCLTAGLKQEVLERARKDAQPAARSLRDLRDPLEWLTTVELLQLREDRELGNVGLEAYMWTKLRNAVVPIRNRAAHMRFIDAQDARTLRTWRLIVSKGMAKPS
ncbi:hypothetical protein [Arthrobacter sp. NPDC092385]|uniref:hypothetical protein n=1 Tax=Arthrobacter sp. NPDC092385 TaxID=3363943 RepID=UPI003822C439